MVSSPIYSYRLLRAEASNDRSNEKVSYDFSSEVKVYKEVWRHKSFIYLRATVALPLVAQTKVS